MTLARGLLRRNEHPPRKDIHTGCTRNDLKSQFTRSLAQPHLTRISQHLGTVLQVQQVHDLGHVVLDRPRA